MTPSVQRLRGWGNVSTAWPSFTDFPTDRECCLGNSRVTLVGLIIAIVGVAFMFGGTSRYFGVASAFGMGTGGVGRRHKVWLSDRLESETDHYARACEG